MERESFVCYKSFVDAGMQLSDQDRLKYFDRLLKYAIYGLDDKTEGFAETLFILTKPNLDANNERFIIGSKQGHHGIKGKEYGKLGGRPPKIDNPPKTPLRGDIQNPPNVDVEEDVEEEVKKKEREKISFGFQEAIELLIQEYNKGRKKKLEKLTDHGRELWKKNLIKLGGDDDGIKLVLEQSIQNGWEGIFELKNKVKLPELTGVDIGKIRNNRLHPKGKELIEKYKLTEKYTEAQLKQYETDYFTSYIPK